MPIAAVVIMTLGVVTSTSAQESRLEQLAAQRREKAETVQPHEPNTAERVLDMMGNFPMLSDSPHGPYPLLGGIMDGAGWLRVGVAYRTNFGDVDHVTTQARVSNRGYWEVGGEVQLLNLVPGRVAVRLDGSHLYARDVSFYGVGNAAAPGDDPDVFAMNATTAGVTGTLRASRLLSFGGRAAYDHVTTGDATLQDPSRMTTARIEEAPGFGRTFDYIHSEVFVDLDWRESPGFTRSGGRYRLGVHQYAHINGSDSSFTRLDAEVAQYFPFLHGNRVVALHGLASLTSVGSDQVIPHFHLPDLGGRNSVRSLPSFRYLDRHRLLLTAEYRWRASEMIEMALFGDAGKVAATTRHFDLHDLHTALGIGIRLHGPTFTAMRMDAAYGAEGLRVIFAVGPVF